MIFDGPNGLRYDTAIHDFIDENGNLASAEDVAAAWGTDVERMLRQIGRNALTG